MHESYITKILNKRKTTHQHKDKLVGGWRVGILHHKGQMKLQLNPTNVWPTSIIVGIE